MKNYKMFKRYFNTKTNVSFEIYEGITINSVKEIKETIQQQLEYIKEKGIMFHITPNIFGPYYTIEKPEFEFGKLKKSLVIKDSESDNAIEIFFKLN